VLGVFALAFLLLVPLGFVHPGMVLRQRGDAGSDKAGNETRIRSLSILQLLPDLVGVRRLCVVHPSHLPLYSSERFLLTAFRAAVLDFVP
jgi:hypothetical protein